ncbi:hypothetical protein CBS101457_003163 [Exobasidium rhododendri]|nr:hypothetical protein CBS101457_003163 [Exobasidium rhododendri]
MRTSAFAVLTTFFALSLVVSAAVIEKTDPTKKDYEGPSDQQIQQLLDTDLKPPYPIGDMTKDPKNVGWRYLKAEESLDKKIPYPAVPTSKGKCKLKVKADLSRCTGSNFRYEPVAYPYNTYSTDMLLAPNATTFHARMEGVENYAYRQFELDCGFNGKILAHERPGSNVQYTGVIAIRVIVDEEYAAMWITSDKDEETGFTSSLNVPPSFYYFGDSEKQHKGKITDYTKRGFEKTTLVTRNVHDNWAYVQLC